MPNSIIFSNYPLENPTQVFGDHSGQPAAIQTDINGNILSILASADGTGDPYSIPLSGSYDLRSITLTPVAGWTFYYNINTDYINVDTGNSGTVTQANCMAVLSTSNVTNGFAKITTKRILRYSPGFGSLARFTAVFTAGAANSSQLIGIGTNENGFFFGYNGTDFSILYIRDGAIQWIAQTDWNVDKMDGTGPSEMLIDPTKGNVYTIQYQWLGFGLISFYISSSVTGQPALVHRIEYPNTSAVPSVYNPCFPLTAMVQNSGNNTNIVLQTPAGMIFSEGDPYSQAIATGNSISASATLSAPVNQNILTLYNTPTFAGKTNMTRIRLNFVSTSNIGFQAVTFKFLKNATLAGSPPFTAINANTSVIQYTAATVTATSQSAFFTFVTPPNIGTQLILDTMNLFLSPGETLTVSASSPNNTQLDCSISWEEMW